ncbi:hypothetical protein DCAR_0414848 [Daucus carota subsp. sativus]|uniref:FCP1 homology domain-containing protein n=1 Tax=Daucus carota subsp. sativus TaxID=79200 RepID=A0AAF0WT28_DAUCS|nr:hypothetical protein DCAR_0414848 [Daucus carota subsp. sativus]
MVRPNDSIGDLKFQIWGATKVCIVHQKLIYPKIGLIRDDSQLLSDVLFLSSSYWWKLKLLMNCIIIFQLKLEEIGVLENPDYKIIMILNRYAMISISTLWLQAPWINMESFYKHSNTIVIDDLRRNFVMNPQNGLMIRRFRKAVDQELSELTAYLLAIAGLDDFSTLDHKKWKTYYPSSSKQDC